MADYLVTGAAGFIAARTTEMLIEQGHRVLGLDNLNDAYDPAIKHKRLEKLQALNGFEFRQGDVCDRPGLGKLFADAGSFDAVVNFAARAGVRQSVANPWAYVETNTTGTLNLLDRCRETGTKKFILASTSSLYGTNNTMPLVETLNTDTPLSPYAASKKAAEAICHSYHHLFGIDVSVFRFFTVYGPAGRPDMSVFRFIQWISEEKPVTVFGDGGQSRDFTYVDDIARGVVAGLKPVGFETFNLGSDSPYELIDVLRRIEKLVGKPAKIDWQPEHRADVRRTWAGVEKAKNILGWEPQVSLDEGLRLSVEWYNDNRDWAGRIETGR